MISCKQLLRKTSVKSFVHEQIDCLNNCSYTFLLYKNVFLFTKDIIVRSHALRPAGTQYGIEELLSYGTFPILPPPGYSRKPLAKPTIHGIPDARIHWLQYNAGQGTCAQLKIDRTQQGRFISGFSDKLYSLAPALPGGRIRLQ